MFENQANPPPDSQEKITTKAAPTGPTVSGRGCGFEAQEQWGDLSLLSSGKGKDLPAEEVSTLGKPLSEKPRANKPSLCVSKCPVQRRFPTSNSSCLSSRSLCKSLTGDDGMAIPARRAACQSRTIRSPRAVGQLRGLNFPFQRSPFAPVTPCFSRLAQLPGRWAEAEALQAAAEQNQKHRLKHD